MRAKPSNPDVGYSDSQLVELSRNRPFRNGFSVWAAWESERTSFGKTFRKQIGYPRFLPLYFCSDHYVDMLSSFRENEAKPKYPLYLSWNKQKCGYLKSVHGVNAVHVQHPWIPYRRKKYPDRNKNARGTLLFWPHSSENLTVKVDIDKAEMALSGLPERYKPISICVSSHDVQLGLIPELRKLNYAIVSVGNVQDQRFVDRFYKLVNNFKYSAGFFPGSHVYYLHEFGIPYLALDYALVTMSVDLLAKDYPDINQREIFENWYNSMKGYTEEVTPDQMAFALEQLGCNSNTTRPELRRLTYCALRKNIHKLPILYFRYFFEKAKARSSGL